MFAIDLLCWSWQQTAERELPSSVLSNCREDELLTAVALRYKDVLQGPPAPSDMPDIPAALDSDSVDGRKALVSPRGSRAVVRRTSIAGTLVATG